MDLGDTNRPAVSDVEISRRKRRTEIGVPQGVTAITEHGVRIPCEVRYSGTERHGYKLLPVYKIIAELNWSTIRIVRIEVKKWPDNVVMLLEFHDSLPGDLPPSWVGDIEWAEVK